MAARMRGLLDDGHSLASAETIVGLQDELASARADADRAPLRRRPPASSRPRTAGGSGPSRWRDKP